MTTPCDYFYLRAKLRKYRVSHLVADLGWVDLDLVSSPWLVVCYGSYHCPGSLVDIDIGGCNKKRPFIGQMAVPALFLSTYLGQNSSRTLRGLPKILGTS